MQLTMVSDHEHVLGFRGSLLQPVGVGRTPGVLVLHGGAGPGEHERSRARTLAELGYAAYVPDLFGEPFRDRAHGIAVIQSLVEKPALLRSRLAAAVRWLREQPVIDAGRLSAIGFCFGGHAALELARSGEELACVVSFHGGLQSRQPAEPGRVKARVLVCTGAADPFVPREHRQAFEDEMSAAGARWELHVYGGVQHGFTEAAARQPGCAYDQHADRESWRAMLDLLAG